MSGISCPDCLTGSIKSSTPEGTIDTIHGLSVYVAKPDGAPSAPKGLIVIITDILGWEVSNPRLLADDYAKEGGYLVYVPDFMNGHIPSASSMYAMDSLLSPSPSIFTTIFYKPLWAIKIIVAIVPFLLSNGEKVIKPKVFKFHEALKADPATAALKMGSAGFCWGGKYTVLLSQQPSLIDAAFTAHPSRVAFPSDWDKIQIPFSMAIGDVDLALKIEMVSDVKKLLEDMKPAGQNEVVIYEGAKHGFAVRANPEDERQVKSAAEAKGQALAWFGKLLV